MNRTILFIFGLLVAVYGVCLRPGLRTKFGIGDGRGSAYYIRIPQYVSEATALNWTKTSRPAGPLPSLDMYCAPELSICALYDSTSFIAGTQLALQKDRFSNATLDWKTQGYSDWTVNGVEYWAMPQFFVDEEFLKTCPEQRIASRDSSRTLQLDSVWITSFYGNLLEIPVNQDGLQCTEWGSQQCITGMGHHYYYNLTNTECSSNLVHPWFILYYQGRLVATLWAAYREYANVDGQRDWFERPNRPIIQASFPTAPKCQYKLSEHTVSLHHWFIDNPWDVVCDSTNQ